MFTRLVALLFITGVALPAAFASHYMGVDISYECLGTCTFRIYHKTYYDCKGGATSIPVNNFNAPGAPTITFTGNGGCAAPVPIGGWQFVSYTEVTPLCPALLNPGSGLPHPTGCQGNGAAPLNGVAEAIYYRDYDFCSTTCTKFTISWYNCCRNGVIDSGAANAGIYSGSTTIDLTISPCNSSPTFLNPPVPYICAGQPFTFNQGAYDPNGDSLSYELGPCFDNAGAPVNYNFGFSPTSPLGPSWQINMNPLTGDLSMIPNPTGNQVVGVMCIVVKEWRNGVQIGQVTRDMQITVIPGCTSTNPQSGGIQSVNIGPDDVPANPIGFQEAKTCPGTDLCFDIPVISQDPTLNYTIFWNKGIPGATFTDAANATVLDTVTGASPVARFCWTPPLTADGAYFFVVTVRDDACPVPGLNQFTIIVYVEDVLRHSDAIGTPTDCNEVQLSFLPVSTIPSPYSSIFPTTVWNGNGNLNLNPFRTDSSLLHLYPAPNDYFFTLNAVDTFGCRVTIPGIVNLTTGVTANAGSDVTICSNYVFPLGTPGLANQNYLWTPPTALSNPLIAQPIFSYPNNGSIQDSLFYLLQVSDTAGICTTYDFVNVYINPTLQTDIVPANPSICIGDSIILTAQGNLIAGNTYLWSTGDTAQSIKVAPRVNTTYSVVSFNNGCSSDIKYTTVQVKVGPPGQIAGNTEVCPGGATTLTAAGGASYLWNAGGFTQANITVANIAKDSTMWVIPYDANGCPGDTVYTTLTNAPKPLAGFTPATGCQGIATQFQDTSSVVNGVIVQWFWDFGDGSTSQEQNPSHTFTNAGSFQVKLIVESERGCRDTSIVAVEVYPIPVPDFTVTKACDGLPINMVSSSTIASGALSSYTWNYGDSTATVSGVTSTTHTYPTFGFYNVALTVVSDRGCPATRKKTAIVHPNPVADFQVLNACQDSVVFLVSGSVVEGSFDFIQSAFWIFGDPTSPNNTSTQFQPTHVYDNPGTYLVSVSVTTDKGCTDATQREVTVYPKPKAEFTYDETCENVTTIFTDASIPSGTTPISYWHWNFGDGKTAVGQNTEHRYNTSGSGTYRVYLAIASSETCVDTAFKDVVINPAPKALYKTVGVCLPDTMKFQDLSTVLTGDIVSWNWQFGDSTGSTYPSPGHRYREDGQYRAQLTVMTDSGCFNVTAQTVTVHPLPETPILTQDTVCFGDNAFLRAITAPDVKVRWYNAVTDSLPFQTAYYYSTPPLPFETTYFVEPVSAFGCVNVRTPVIASVYEPNTLAINSSATVLELPLALANFNSSATIDLKKWSWAFGDGSTSNVADPAYQYQYPGIYNVTLKADDANGCPLEASTIIEVKKVSNISLPSAFSPNGDGINDTYRIGYYKMETFSIMVFNRWGQLVFASSNPDFEWDGRDTKGNDVPEGVYVYNLSAVDVNGQGIEEARTITVVR